MNNYKYFVNNFKQGIIGIDENLTICCFNEAAKSFTGWNTKDIIGKCCSEILETPSCSLNKSSPAFNEPCIQFMPKIYIKNKHGNSIPIKLSNVPIKDDQQNIQGIIKIFLPCDTICLNNSNTFERFGLLGSSPEIKKTFK